MTFKEEEFKLEEELMDKILDAQEDFANLDWISKDQALEIITQVFSNYSPQLQEDKINIIKKLITEIREDKNIMKELNKWMKSLE
ncbi:MAG: hypothetical protein KKB88_05920 [Nanoarchaeota archaeon]|nr:hypothetical protein [Nanoarchaeota archaeon]